MRLLTLSVLLLTLLFSVVGCGVAELPAYSSQFDPKRDAFADLKSAVGKAQKEQKLILLEFGGDWCRWCHIMDAFFVDNPQIKKDLLKVFVLLKVNVSEENGNETFLKDFPEIPGYPHFLILDNEGALIAAQGTAELEQGESYSLQAFQTFIDKWEHY
ncbi:thioredoxin family protein [Aurantivibrio infirmus]